MLTKLEQAASVTLTSSGVAAISSTLLTFTRPGTHLLVADHVYGNTRAFCDGMLSALGVEVTYFDPMIGSGITKLMHKNTCAVMFEAPGSGTFEVPDIPAIATAARTAGIPSIIDGTWATPIFCQPLSLGVDVVIASLSKYLSGYSDCMMGMIACNDKYAQAIRKTVMSIGDKTGAQEVFLALRGLRTLNVRMEHFNSTGREMAHWFEQQSQVKRVLHPALESCTGHSNWQRDFTGASGLFGVVFHPCSDNQIRQFIDKLEHFGIGVSWGGYESLVLPVKPQRSANTWNEDGQLVRFNIGFENTDSLKADLAKALPILNS